MDGKFQLEHWSNAVCGKFTYSTTSRNKEEARRILDSLGIASSKLDSVSDKATTDELKEATNAILKENQPRLQESFSGFAGMHPGSATTYEAQVRDFLTAKISRVPTDDYSGSYGGPGLTKHPRTDDSSPVDERHPPLMGGGLVPDADVIPHISASNWYSQITLVHVLRASLEGRASIEVVASNGALRSELGRFSESGRDKPLALVLNVRKQNHE